MVVVPSCAFFSVGTVGLSRAGGRKPSTLWQAARHNLREGQNERGGRAHIDATRSHLNEVVAGPGSAEGVVALSQARIREAGVNPDKLRSDHVQAVELLFSLPAGSEMDDGAYFRACVVWTEEHFGTAHILSACVHRDEPCAHCHILILPVVMGRMAGSALITKPALTRLRTSFFREVAAAFGLVMPRERMTGAERRQAADAVLARLNATKDPCMRSAVWSVIRAAIEANPAEFAHALGIDLCQPAKPHKRMRTMAQIFTSPGKGGEDRARSQARFTTRRARIVLAPERVPSGAG